MTDKLQLTDELQHLMLMAMWITEELYSGDNFKKKYPAFLQHAERIGAYEFRNRVLDLAYDMVEAHNVALDFGYDNSGPDRGTDRGDWDFTPRMLHQIHCHHVLYEHFPNRLQLGWMAELIVGEDMAKNL